jgi:hypothetical protein
VCGEKISVVRCNDIHFFSNKKIMTEPTNNFSLPPFPIDETNLPLSDSQIEFAGFLGNLLGTLWRDEWKRQHLDNSDDSCTFDI